VIQGLPYPGFPFTRKVKRNFRTLLQQSNYLEKKADIHFLCMHQTIEGAKVGSSNYTFRAGPDNIPGSEIPDGLTAVLSGQIHRGQCLTHTLDHRPFSAPVIYPGSIECASFAERFEGKYYVLITVDPACEDSVAKFEYHPLQARPMVKIEISTQDRQLVSIKKIIKEKLFALDPDSIVRTQLTGSSAEEFQRLLSARNLRILVPPTMNISLAYQWKRMNERPKVEKEVHQPGDF